MKKFTFIIIISFIILGILGLEEVYTADSSTIVQDNFNAYMNGSVVNQGGWNGYKNGENFIVQGDTIFEGTKAIYVDTLADSVIYKTGTPLADGRQVVYVKTQNRYGWGLYTNGNAQVRVSKGSWEGSELRNFIAVSFKSGGNVAYYDPASGTYRNFATYNDNEWTSIEFEWRSSDNNARYRTNGGTWTNWYPFAGSGTFSDFDTVGFDFYLPSGSGGVYFDSLALVSMPPLCDSDTWSCSDWEKCSASGTQTRTCNKLSICEGGVQPPPTSQSCTPPCLSDTWSCSDWSTCSIYGSQTRTCSKTFDCPTDNTPSPPTSQSCTPPCLSDTWSCGDWSACSVYGTRNRTCAKTFDCPTANTPSPSTSQGCTPPPPPCNADTWTCGSWGECSLSGIQSRNCTKTFDCPDVQTAPPITDQYCEPPSRPTPQIPPNSTNEILNQDSIIKSSVKLLCPVDAQRASQGSGTVIDPSGIILTNKHVIAGTLGCLVGFINDFNDEPYFGERQIADIFKVSSSQDVAILKIRNPQNKRLTSIDITKENSNLRLGTKITIYGYPAKFGTKITYTSGDFSGTHGSYLKTTAILEYGNSGGGAYLKDGTFIGIPSAVVKGELNALGYLLSINTINAWLGNSSIVSGSTSNNQYSRVSVLEDIDLNNLGTLKLFIPDTDAKGDLSVPTTNQNLQNAKKQSQADQTQEESIVIESAGKNQKTSPEQDNSVSSEEESIEESGKENQKNQKEKKDNFGISIAEQRRSMVVNAVQEMVHVAERNGGVGQEIKVIAQTQTQNQEKLEIGIQKIQSRSGFAKFFIGPNYGEIKNSQKLLEQSKKQIQQLNQLRTQIINQGDQLQIVGQIQLLERANQQMETSLGETQKRFSLFGWIFKLFTK